MPGDGAPRRRLRAVVWLAGVALVALATGLAWPGAGWLRTDVRALLPDPGDDAERVAQATRSLSEPFEQSTLWLVGAERAERAVAGARSLADRLRTGDVFASVRATVDREPFERLARAYRPYRHGLIAPGDARRLAEDPDAFLRRQLARQYSVAGAAGGSLAGDPLGLYRGFLRQALATGPARAGTVVDGVVVIEGRGRHYAVVTAEARRDAFAAAGDPPILQSWRAALEWAADEDYVLHATGAPLYSAHAAANAHQEISLIGGLSLLAITVLLVGRFRSPRPLAVTLVVVAAGVGGGFAGALLVFGGMHLITLVFGATVIGVSVDYAFHYLADSLRPGWTPEDGLRHVLPSLRLALATSALAFLTLALAPFPALRQVAVFTVCGLVAAWLTVVLLLPQLVRPPRSAPAPRARWPRLRVPARRIVALVLVLALPGLFLLEPSDDVRLLYSAPERLSADDDAIGSLLPRPDGNRFLLVHAGSAQGLLERLESLRPALERLQASDAMAGYRSVTEWLPSRERQQRNERLLRELVDSGALREYLTQLGFAEQAIAEQVQAIRSPGPYLEVDTALGVVPARLAAQWQGCTAGDCTAAVLVTGAGEGRALAELAAGREGVRWVNRIAAVNESMRTHRRLSLVLLAGALLVVATVLALALGMRRGLGVVAVPAVALVVSLAVVGYTGALFSVFNLMALLLVLGVGIDYALFHHCAPPQGRPTAALGIGMAASTTILAFGLLVFSETPVISAFGTTLLPGLTVAWLLALITGRMTAGDAKE